MTRGVVSQALFALQGEGRVSPDERNRYRVNAGYASHQLQLVRNQLERVERLSTNIYAILRYDPRTARRFQQGEGR